MMLFYWVVVFTVFDEYAQIYQAQKDRIQDIASKQLADINKGDRETIKMSEQEVKIKTKSFNANLVNRLKQK